LVVGPSNCGKTNVMLSLIESPNGLKFENIFVFSKSLYQPKYEYLEKLINPVKGMGYYTLSQNYEVLPPAKAKENSIMIFDDVACEKQNNLYGASQKYRFFLPMSNIYSYSKTSNT